MSQKQHKRERINLLWRKTKPLEESPIKDVDLLENVRTDGNKASYWDVGMSWL